MAKPLVFHFHQETTECELHKVDRAKLYGYKEVEILDDQGAKCEIATLAEDGHTLIGRGGTGFAYLTSDGRWCDKSQLKPTDLSGNLLAPVPSSFSAPIELTKEHEVTADDYLMHTIRSIYQMDVAKDSQLMQQVRQGTLYKFQYSFRGGLESDTAFLLANEAGVVFMAVGRPANANFVGLQQVTVAEDDSSDEEDEDIDFGMI